MKHTPLIFRLLLIFAYVGALVVFVLVFSDFFNDFPIGLDAAQHIVWARSFFENAYPTNLYHGSEIPSPYPVPEIVLALIVSLFDFSWTEAFPVVITLFHALSSLTVFLIVRRFFGLVPAVISAFIALFMPFSLDELPIGIFAQVFGRALFFLLVYLLLMKRYILLVIFFLISYFVHPLVLLLFVSLAIVLGPFFLIEHRVQIIEVVKKRKKLMVVLGLILGFAMVLLFVTDNRFVDVLQSDQNVIQGGPAYDFSSIVKRNIVAPFLYGLAAIGYFSLFYFRKKRLDSDVFLVFMVLPFVLMYYVFGKIFLVNIDPYRFISFLEMAVAIFAGIGVWYLVRTFKKSFVYPFVILVMVWLFIVSLSGGYSILQWFQREGSPDRLPAGEIEAMQWMDDVLPKNALVCADYRWGYWVPTLAKRPVLLSEFIPMCPHVFYSDRLEEINREINEKGYEYIFVSSESEVNPIVVQSPEHFLLVYDKNDVLIYEVK